VVPQPLELARPGGFYGTVYDYDYANGIETSHNNADSTDSYAGTFLSLAWAY